MKVKELISQLSEADPEAEIILSSDEEGNYFYRVNGIDTGRVTLYNGRIETYYSDQHSDDQCCLESGQREKLQKVVCLLP